MGLVCAILLLTAHSPVTQATWPTSVQLVLIECFFGEATSKFICLFKSIEYKCSTISTLLAAVREEGGGNKFCLLSGSVSPEIPAMLHGSDFFNDNARN